MQYKKITPISDKGIEVTAEKKKRYPKLSIPLKDLSEAKNWDVGQIYHIAFELEMSGISIGEWKDEATFDMKGIKVLKVPRKKVKRYTT